MNEAVSCVVRIIHELVYSIIHQHVCLRKMESETPGEGLIQQIHEPLKKWDKTLYQYFGAVLQHKITLRKKTFAGKNDQEICQNSRNWLWRRSWKSYRNSLQCTK